MKDQNSFEAVYEAKGSAESVSVVPFFKVKRSAHNPLLVSWPQRSDFDDQRSDTMNDEEILPSESRPRHNNSRRIMLGLILFFILVSCGMAIALIVLRTSSNDSSGDGIDQLNSGEEDSYVVISPKPMLSPTPAPISSDQQSPPILVLTEKPTRALTAQPMSPLPTIFQPQPVTIEPATESPTQPPTSPPPTLLPTLPATLLPSISPPSLPPTLTLTQIPTVPVTFPPTASPTLQISQSPTVPFTFPPTPPPPTQPPTLPPSLKPVVPEPTADHSIVLASGSSMSRNEALYSPNGLYSLLMDDFGNLILFGKNDAILWRTQTEIGAETCHMQTDGNLVLRAADRSSTWRSDTSGNDGAYLILDAEGQLAIVCSTDAMMPLWLTGVPKGRYSIFAASASVSFPVRGAFYYPWFPETWTINGHPTIYTPTLGNYSNEQSAVHQAHVDALDYANVDLAIASWFGPDTHLDRARLTNLLHASRGKSVKWTIYHEIEARQNQTVAEIQTDLAYLKEWFAWHEQWAHIDGKPLIFVYNEGNNCDVSNRWVAAAAGEWFVVLKRFRNHELCGTQPDHWHEYAPVNAIVHDVGISYSISPGYWRADQESATLPRVAYADWRTNVQSMVDSGEPWQLITTFNQWGEGTAVESGAQWQSASGYGEYLDALHEIL